jgi:lipoic acid synthetase
MQRLPPWIRIRLKTGGRFAAVHHALGAAGLNTVCEHARCPNRPECFQRGTATFLILGNRCTRQCRFCAVRNGTPAPADPDEPRRVAELAAELGLRHVVVTSVSRDDLPDGGAGAFAATIRLIKQRPEVTVEVLTPDFSGKTKALAAVLDAKPDVFNHNLETVERLQPLIRPQANYQRSLFVLLTAARALPRPGVKSGLMVGLGETDAELFEALADLRTAGCELLTLGQYLAPSRRHLPVARFVSPDQFAAYREKALAMGFKAVAAGPLVRSSYQAETLLRGEPARSGNSSHGSRSLGESGPIKHGFKS